MLLHADVGRKQLLEYGRGVSLGATPAEVGGRFAPPHTTIISATSFRLEQPADLPPAKRIALDYCNNR